MYMCVILITSVCHVGNRILAATERLQLWAPPTSDTLIEEEDSQLNDDRAHELMLNDWKCVWQCKWVQLKILTTLLSAY